MSTDQELRVTATRGTIDRARLEVEQSQRSLRLRGALFPLASKIALLTPLEASYSRTGVRTRHAGFTLLLLLLGIEPIGVLILGLGGALDFGFLSGISFGVALGLYLGSEIIVGTALALIASSVWELQLTLEADPWLELETDIRTLGLENHHGLDLDFARLWTGPELLQHLDALEAALPPGTN
jgi:hypothetical protein